ncbi:hypothetical protein X801_07223 [Opisthorchis viverrini]|uniref:Uncharacterized protein n=2 Tax=Opisthorchis viverrini TaxID=6198 RepID=A0A1S8WRB4_OPIVI|nr:hypothetical protein T265_10388 [Opisthorchis viverrini]KER21227.1 hypothetical protein T265_10388 [Opisthorchis viverrini]OON16945.1 hypothetical protein X801_07223 [Opisthorchis viverrini]
MKATLLVCSTADSGYCFLIQAKIDAFWNKDNGLENFTLHILSLNIYFIRVPRSSTERKKDAS